MGRRVKFGPFELDRHTGELWKHGLKIKLQGKPFQVLTALLEKPGEPVSREELQQRLWNGDTFVDFESGLNTAANRLRLALGDSVDNPRYVETLARSGYRFVGHVEEIVEVARTTPTHPSRKKPRWLYAAVPASLVIMAVVVWILMRPGKPTPAFRQLTFRTGLVDGARFTRDGQTILYSARWEGERWRLFLANSVSPETRTLGFERSILTAISPSGELLLKSPSASPNEGVTLSRVPMNGGAPLTVSTRVVAADWSPDGKQIAAVRFEQQKWLVEFPLGRVLYQTSNMLNGFRVSPDGQAIAFAEHPARNEDGGDVRVVDTAGHIQTVSAGWGSLEGVAWSASGSEVWFTGAKTGAMRALWAVTRGGRLRPVARIPGALTLEDISRDGRVLFLRKDQSMHMAGRLDGDEKERDLSWFDWSGAADISADGKLVLFDESGEGGGPNWTTYLRSSADDSALRLGEGHALALAPDGRTAAILNAADRHRIHIVPTGVGQPRDLPPANIEYQWVRYFPDGRRLLVGGNEPGRGVLLYVQSLDSGKLELLKPETDLQAVVISPDGAQIAGLDHSMALILRSVEGGQSRVVPISERVSPAGWMADGSLLVRDLGRLPLHVYQLDLSTGQMKQRAEVGAIYGSIYSLTRLKVTPDARSYVYSWARVRDELYLADGWR